MASKTAMDICFPGKPQYRDNEEVQFCSHCLEWVPVAERKQHIEREHLR